jgi:arylsulfatase A-like enzyme
MMNFRICLILSLAYLAGCGGGGGSSATGTVNATDTVPNTFSLTDQTDVALGTLIQSIAFTITGIDAPTAISVTGGEYSIDGGSYTSSPGTVSSGQTARVRHTSSANPSTTVATVVTIGGISGTFSSTTAGTGTDPEPISSPNILLILSDDVGLDATSGYPVGLQLPTTPTLDGLAAKGLTFDNAWAYPMCSPTRATILTGRYGYRTGVLSGGDDIPTAETSLQDFIDTNVPNVYEHAVFGKWHLAGNSNGGDDNPQVMGIEHFSGLIPSASGVDNYNTWTHVENGQRSQNQTYTTTAFVDLAIDWIAGRDKPWFAWLAFNAPHAPFHLPPLDLHDRALSANQNDIGGNPLPYYLAAIEAMDQEIGRLLASLSPETLANTTVIYMGDNGTPGRVAQTYARSHAKGSVYEGGVAVPLVIAGANVTRSGQRESALVSSVDLFATIATLAGTATDEINDSKNFADLLAGNATPRRAYSYSETNANGKDDWTIRNSRYKLVQQVNTPQELYDLELDPYEQDNLLDNGINVSAILAELRAQAELIRQ